MTAIPRRFDKTLPAPLAHYAQFALWCIMKSPLLIGSFLHNMTDATLATVSNRLAIAVNQDPLGEQGSLRKDGGYMPNKPRPTTNPAYGCGNLDVLDSSLTRPSNFLWAVSRAFLSPAPPYARMGDYFYPVPTR